MEVPEYKCQKRVRAARIAAIEFAEDGRATIAPADVGLEPFIVLDITWKERFKGSEDDLGFYVVYTDGYTSWSPSLAFETGYSRI